MGKRTANDGYSPGGVRKLALVDPDVLRKLLGADASCPTSSSSVHPRHKSNRGSGPGAGYNRNKKKIMKKKKVRIKGNKKGHQLIASAARAAAKAATAAALTSSSRTQESRGDPSWPGGVLADPETERMVALRDRLDRLITNWGARLPRSGETDTLVGARDAAPSAGAATARGLAGALQRDLVTARLRKKRRGLGFYSDGGLRTREEQEERYSEEGEEDEEEKEEEEEERG